MMKRHATLLAAVAVLVLVALAAQTAYAATSGAPLGSIAIIDLSHPIENGIPLFFSILKGVKTIATVSENGYYMNLLEMTEHTSTHMDAPAHFIATGRTIDKIPLG